MRRDLVAAINNSTCALIISSSSGLTTRFRAFSKTSFARTWSLSLYPPSDMKIPSSCALNEYERSARSAAYANSDSECCTSSVYSLRSDERTWTTKLRFDSPGHHSSPNGLGGNRTAIAVSVIEAYLDEKTAPPDVHEYLSSGQPEAVVFFVPER